MSEQLQRVIQVNVYKDKENPTKEYELESLIKTAGAVSEVYVSQVISKVNPSFYIGRGKVFEIKEIAEKNDIKTCVFDVELSASQVRNLEETMKIKVVDWTTLILDIFAKRANTKESKLKIKLAQLKYSLPRLNKWFSYLSRQAGGIGTRGPGESMLETDRRAVIRDIKSLSHQIRQLEATKSENRKSRKNILNVALMGYTNAGKSTILNQMLKHFGSDKKVYSDDLLFATLDTSTRKITVNKREITLTDTVGFIDNLSKELNDSFLTTIDEIKFADMILIVIDSSMKDMTLQLETIDKTIKDINLTDKNILYVFNKIDKLDDLLKVKGFRNKENRIFISAKKDEDMIRLKDEIYKIITADYKAVTLSIPYTKPDILNYFMSNYEIEKTHYTNTKTILSLKISPIDYKKYESYINHE